MLFIHCERCNRTLRTGALRPDGIDRSDDDVALFDLAHAACRLRFYAPTGRAAASGPWHEPMVERRIEVRDGDSVAVLVGRRRALDEPLEWCLEHGPLDEDMEVALDADLFWDDVDRALYPHHVPKQQVAAWATHLEKLLRLLTPAELVVVHDDPHRPGSSAAYPHPETRGALEASLRAIGFDPTTAARLRRLLEGAEFPPLRVTRRLARSGVRARAERARARLDSPDPLV